MQEVYVDYRDTVEVVLTEGRDDRTVRVTGNGEILVNVIDEDGREKGFFAKIEDIVKSPEEMDV